MNWYRQKHTNKLRENKKDQGESILKDTNIKILSISKNIIIHTTFKICYFKFNSLFQILEIRYNDFFKFVITNLIRYNGF